jgi:uncharacterized protein (DUF362 family)
LSSPTVAIVRGDEPKEMIKEIFELLDLSTIFLDEYQRSFLKPNICGGVPGKPGSFTNPELVGSLIKFLRGSGTEISVGEADSCMYPADLMLKETGIEKISIRNGAKVVNLSKGDMTRVSVSEGSALKSFLVNKEVAESDAIISMPVMKTHKCTTITLGMKVMFGVLPERRKSKYHPKIDDVIVDVNSALMPNLTIIDAITGMEGEGPFQGDPIELNLVIAGDNVVSTDACGAFVMGIDPLSVEHLRLASERGLGTLKMNEIEVRGESIESVRKEFKKAIPERRERVLSRISERLGYAVMHRHYEEAVRSWKKEKR